MFEYRCTNPTLLRNTLIKSNKVKTSALKESYETDNSSLRGDYVRYTPPKWGIVNSVVALMFLYKKMR